MTSNKTNTNLMMKLPKALTETGYLEVPVTIGQYSNIGHSQYHHMQFHNFVQRTKTPMTVYTMMIQRSTRMRQANLFRLLLRAHRKNLLLQGAGRK